MTAKQFVSLRLNYIVMFFKSIMFSFALPLRYCDTEQSRTIQGLRIMRILRKNMRNAKFTHDATLFPTKNMMHNFMCSECWARKMRPNYSLVIDLIDEAESLVADGCTVRFDAAAMELVTVPTVAGKEYPSRI
jgi:hypothetical protein